MYSVEFVLNDYVQFRFDGSAQGVKSATLNSYVWPVVEFGGRTWREGNLGYADAMRLLTPGAVVATTEQIGPGIRIELNAGAFAIHPPRRRGLSRDRRDQRLERWRMGGVAFRRGQLLKTFASPDAGRHMVEFYFNV
ncbi:MAG: hypothetical protein ACK5H2_06775 [Beutenbergiaceae bacterium]